MLVLHVDEDEMFLQVTKRLLAGHGIETLPVTRSERAQEMAEMHLPRLVLLSLKLSGQNGFDVLRALKGAPDSRDIPVVVWTALAAREDVERCTRLGVQAYFIKTQHQPREVVGHVLACLQGVAK